MALHHALSIKIKCELRRVGVAGHVCAFNPPGAANPEAPGAAALFGIDKPPPIWRRLPLSRTVCLASTSRRGFSLALDERWRMSRLASTVSARRWMKHALIDLRHSMLIKFNVHFTAL